MGHCEYVPLSTFLLLCLSCTFFFFLLLLPLASPVRPASPSSQVSHQHFYRLHPSSYYHANNISHGDAQYLTSSKTLTPGLSFHFYSASCPHVHTIVGREVRRSIHNNPSDAAGLLRLLFHDCFVQGCDASILLKVPFSEQHASPNNASLRMSSLKLIDNIKEILEVACPQIVSCADIIVLASREAIFLAGGPLVPMPLGRRDGIAPAPNTLVMRSLPSPLHGFKALLNNFQQHGLDLKDLVALSGAHSIGEAHCQTLFVQHSLFIPSKLDKAFSLNVSKVCPKKSSQEDLTIHLDFLSKDHFDNNYFKNVLAKRVIFPSDLALLDNPQSKSFVELFAHNEEKFFEQFGLSILKLSQTQTLVGPQGEIRHECTQKNSN